jgi:hypothetical protein
MFSAVAIRLSVKKLLENSRTGSSANARLALTRKTKLKIEYIILKDKMSLKYLFLPLFQSNILFCELFENMADSKKNFSLHIHTLRAIQGIFG